MSEKTIKDTLSFTHTIGFKIKNIIPQNTSESTVPQAINQFTNSIISKSLVTTPSRQLSPSSFHTREALFSPNNQIISSKKKRKNLKLHEICQASDPMVEKDYEQKLKSGLRHENNPRFSSSLKDEINGNNIFKDADSPKKKILASIIPIKPNDLIVLSAGQALAYGNWLDPLHIQSPKALGDQKKQFFFNQYPEKKIDPGKNDEMKQIIFQQSSYYSKKASFEDTDMKKSTVRLTKMKTQSIDEKHENKTSRSVFNKKVEKTDKPETIEWDETLNQDTIERPFEKSLTRLTTNRKVSPSPDATKYICDRVLKRQHKHDGGNLSPNSEYSYKDMHDAVIVKKGQHEKAKLKAFRRMKTENNKCFTHLVVRYVGDRGVYSQRSMRICKDFILKHNKEDQREELC